MRREPRRSYFFASRFQNDNGTNPEELIGAVEAKCYAMALAKILEEVCHDSERIDVEAESQLDVNVLEITTIQLAVQEIVPDIDGATSHEHAEYGKENYPVSKVLAVPAIKLDAQLQG